MENKPIYEILNSIRLGCADASTRDIAIEYLKIRYYEFQAGHLWILSEKRELTQAEKVRPAYYEQHPNH